MEKIAENFYKITLPMPFRLRHVHVFALVHNGKVALFDTGMNSTDSLSKLDQSLKLINKTIGDIDQIYVTHFHTDHCGMAGRIKEMAGSAIAMSEIDKERIHNDQGNKLDTNQIKSFYREQGLTEKFINTLVELLLYFRKSTIPFQVDTSLKDYEHQKLGDMEFEVIPVPGHTSGQVCFFFRKERILLSGDHILFHITPNLSPDPYNPDFRPLRSYLDSLQRVKEFQVDRVYPSHGESFTNLKSRVREIEDHHRERKDLVYKSVKGGPKTTFQISLDIFGSNLPEFDQFLAVNETYAHLIELKEEQIIKPKKAEKHILYSV